MRNSRYRTNHDRGSSPSIQDVEYASDARGVDWFQSSRQIRDDESSADTKKRVPDQKPCTESQAGNNAPGRGKRGKAVE
jgi:hypothetical protein